MSEKNNSYFSNKIIFVTGGTNGIGKQIVEDLVQTGAKLITCSNRPSSVKKTKKEFDFKGLTVDVKLCDIGNQNDLNKISKFIYARYKRLDILINNAGYATYRPFEESSINEVNDIINVNLTGTIKCTKTFINKMIDRKGGQIVNISSIAGSIPITPNAIYCGAKTGIVAWSNAIRYELSRFNIKVNVICPGYTKTNFHNHPTFRRRDPYRKKNSTPLQVSFVSDRIIKSIRNDTKIKYIPYWHKYAVWIYKSFPLVIEPILNFKISQRVNQLYKQIKMENEKT